MRIGIIGSGFGLYGLLPAFNSIKNCKVVSICGKKTDRLVNYCTNIGLTHIYTDWKEMLDNEDLDAVAIAVVPSAQYEIVQYAIKRGINVFAEKPLTANLAQAKKLLALSKKYKVTTAVDFIFPEIGEWQKVKQILDKKTYGKLESISVEWDFLSYDIKNKIQSWKTDIKQGGGALSFFASHVLYYLEYYAGKIVKSKSILSYSKDSLNGGDVGVDSVLTFKNGVSGKLHVSCNNPKINNHKVTFICQKATIVLENTKDVTDSFTLTIATEKSTKRLIVKKAKIKAEEDQRVAVVKGLATRFINAARLHKQITPSFSDGVRVQELIQIIRKK